jgi:Uma2 family endonuclease
MPDQSTLTSVEEYLNTSYADGDREYVDGHIVERNLGEKPHSKVQGEVHHLFRLRRRSLGTFSFVEQRVQVKPHRFRIPDVCVYVNREPDEDVFVTPPFLVVEVLSRDDRASDLEEKIDDYLEFGVPYIWVIDPRRRIGWVHTVESSREAKDGVLRTRNPDIEMALGEIFSEEIR